MICCGICHTSTSYRPPKIIRLDIPLNQMTTCIIVGSTGGVAGREKGKLYMGKERILFHFESFSATIVSPELLCAAVENLTRPVKMPNRCLQHVVR